MFQQTCVVFDQTNGPAEIYRQLGIRRHRMAFDKTRRQQLWWWRLDRVENLFAGGESLRSTPIWRGLEAQKQWTKRLRYSQYSTGSRAAGVVVSSVSHVYSCILSLMISEESVMCAINHAVSRLVPPQRVHTTKWGR